MDHCEKEKKKPNPRDNANIFSILTFFYTSGMIRKALKKDLEEENLYEVINSCESQKCGDKLEAKWKRHNEKMSHPTVYNLLFKRFAKEYVLLGLIQLVWQCIMLAVSADALESLIHYFKKDSEMTIYDAWKYGGTIIGMAALRGIYFHNYVLALQKFALKVRTSFSALIYRKALKLTPSALSKISLGNIVTLITKDITAFEMNIWTVNDMWTGIIVIIYASVLIYNRLGLVSFLGIGCLFAILPLQVYLGKLVVKMRLGVSRKTDERLQVTQEVLSSIKIIKMYTWEKFFNDRMTAARRKEVSKMLRSFLIRIFGIIFGVLSYRIGFYVLIISYIWKGGDIDAGLIYYILHCFNYLRNVLAFDVPYGLARSGELYATLFRMNRVLNAEELSEIEEIYAAKPLVSLKNVHVDINDAKILKSISLSIKSGLTLISGAVGSGKSSLVKTILKDYPIKDGELTVEGRISYASQDPWLFPSSIRQNILFGETFDKARYDEVIRVCALKFDLDLFDNGDETILSDRGHNLSKGQQSRINLARAIYKDSDIYLIDDSLTALDSNVQDFIFSECIKGFLKDKMVIMVTQNISQMKEADNVIILQDGEIKSIGNPDEINEEDLKFDIPKTEDELTEEKEEQQVEEKEEDEVNDETSLIEAEQFTKKKVYKETKKEGNVSINVYWKYVNYGGNLFYSLSIVLLYFGSQYADSTTEVVLKNWINRTEISYMIFKNESNSEKYQESVNEANYTLNIYSAIIGLAVVLSLTKTYCLLNFTRIASLNIHKAMSKSIINAVTSFHDTHFIGNVLNRFSQDLNNIDERLPSNIMEVFRCTFTICGILLTISFIKTIFLIPALIFVIITIGLKQIYMPTGRSLQRLESTSRSPIIGHLNSSLEGLTTIRAYKAQDTLRDEYDRYQNVFTSAHFMYLATSRALGMVIELFCSLFTVFTIFNFLYLDTDVSSQEVGLVITQVLALAGNMQWGMRQWAELENMMTSTERVLEYTEIKQEEKLGRTLETWPTDGQVIFKSVSLSYNGYEKVLKNLDFSVQSKQKIGIVGRTGAGKSSIIAALFRLYEFDGSIIIDGVDTKSLSLDFLRQSIAIIPQDPVLFSGTIRTNIDPMGIYTDQQIWIAIEKVKIKYLVPNLDLVINENGSNFSAGQRQLFCLARAIIRKNKIVVLDEATANMDPETDTLLHETINLNFNDCTIFIIAHRLHSIIDSDKILVLDRGEIIEFDDPINLLENKDGHFYKMVEQSGLLPTIQ